MGPCRRQQAALAAREAKDMAGGGELDTNIDEGAAFTLPSGQQVRREAVACGTGQGPRARARWPTGVLYDAAQCRASLVGLHLAAWCTYCVLVCGPWPSWRYTT